MQPRTSEQIEKIQNIDISIAPKLKINSFNYFYWFLLQFTSIRSDTKQLYPSLKSIFNILPDEDQVELNNNPTVYTLTPKSESWSTWLWSKKNDFTPTNKKQLARDSGLIENELWKIAPIGVLRNLFHYDEENLDPKYNKSLPNMIMDYLRRKAIVSNPLFDFNAPVLYAERLSIEYQNRGARNSQNNMEYNMGILHNGELVGRVRQDIDTDIVDVTDEKEAERELFTKSRRKHETIDLTDESLPDVIDLTRDDFEQQQQQQNLKPSIKKEPKETQVKKEPYYEPRPIKTTMKQEPYYEPRPNQPKMKQETYYEPRPNQAAMNQKPLYISQSIRPKSLPIVKREFTAHTPLIMPQQSNSLPSPPSSSSSSSSPSSSSSDADDDYNEKKHHHHHHTPKSMFKKMSMLETKPEKYTVSKDSLKKHKSVKKETKKVSKKLASKGWIDESRATEQGLAKLKQDVESVLIPDTIIAEKAVKHHHRKNKSNYPESIQSETLFKQKQKPQKHYHRLEADVPTFIQQKQQQPVRTSIHTRGEEEEEEVPNFPPTPRSRQLLLNSQLVGKTSTGKPVYYDSTQDMSFYIALNKIRNQKRRVRIASNSFINF